jgi:hypothetical protein
MLTLIRREVVDHAAYLLMAALLSAIMSGPLMFRRVLNAGVEAFVLVIWVLPFALFGFCAMGIGQMYADRAGRISSFLSTQAVTRGQILLARFLVGLLAILILLVPLGIAAVVVLQDLVPPFMFYSHFVARVYAVVFLVATANYCLGLQIGWYTRKSVLIFGALLPPSILMSLVIIKGFAVDGIVVLSLFVLALIVSVALKFRSTPL